MHFRRAVVDAERAHVRENPRDDGFVRHALAADAAIGGMDVDRYAEAATDLLDRMIDYVARTNPDCDGWGDAYTMVDDLLLGAVRDE